MSERYIKLFSLSPRMYAKGSPVVIEAGALHVDTVVGDVVAQLKFSSLMSGQILALTAEFVCYNAANEVVTPSFVYRYKGEEVALHDGFFAQRALITLPDAETRAFSVQVTKVEFADGNIVALGKEAWKSLPSQETVSRYGAEFERYFRHRYGAAARCVPLQHKDVWLCACGEANKADQARCIHCGVAQNDLFPFDIEEEQKCAVYVGAQVSMKEGRYEEAIARFETLSGWKDADIKIYACQKKIEEVKAKKEAEEQITKRNTKIAKIAMVILAIVCTVAVFINCLNSVIIPNSKYNKAIALMEAGNVVEAYEAFVALDGYKDSVDKANSIYDKYKAEKLKVAKAGDYVFFGAHEQDNNTQNGKEDVEWLVLEVKDGKALVISKYALDCKPYNTSYADVTWETCSLRKWLNGAFINNAFSVEEQAMIPTVTVSADKNPEYNTNPGNATQDQVFLLSITEANKYFGSNSARQCKPTKLAVANGAYVNSDDGNCWWWLRSPGSNQDYAANVYVGGDVGEYGDFVRNHSSAVRPALWIDLNS